MALTALLAGPAAAQQAGTIDAGVFGRYSFFDETLGVDDAFGFGGRLGVFVLRQLALEVDASYTPTEAAPGADVNYLPIHARAIYHLPVAERLALLVGGGYTHNEYSSSFDGSDDGVGGLLGLRFGLTEQIQARLAGTLDYIPSPANLASDNINLGVQLGVGILLGAAKDTDGDGVADKRDACPDTPMGQAVDPSGCLLDTDRDGVPDMNDRCGGTPAGAPVDARGCPRDTDGDGVIDLNDACNGTPAGTPVDARGCPRDADGDGVADNLDRCADTPAGTPVDARGCPRDTDGDGVADHLDRCPDTPRGATVNATGCPSDADGDGVFDGIDRCANTAAGTRVDRTGCPVLFEEGATAVVLEGVTFETGSARLTAQARAVLDRVAESLVANPEIRVEVAGHTDSQGGADANQRLSQARADAVKTYLGSKGVAAERLTARGYGEANPIADNGTAAGRARNRRVELRRM